MDLALWKKHEPWKEGGEWCMYSLDQFERGPRLQRQYQFDPISNPTISHYSK